MSLKLRFPNISGHGLGGFPFIQSRPFLAYTDYTLMSRTPPKYLPPELKEINDPDRIAKSGKGK